MEISSKYSTINSHQFSTSLFCKRSQHQFNFLWTKFIHHMDSSHCFSLFTAYKNHVTVQRKERWEPHEVRYWDRVIDNCFATHWRWSIIPFRPFKGKKTQFTFWKIELKFPQRFYVQINIPYIWYLLIAISFSLILLLSFSFSFFLDKTVNKAQRILNSFIDLILPDRTQ